MPPLDPAACRQLVAEARVARLATVTAAGLPHVVPVCFALHGDLVVTAVDGKPKSTSRLRRLDNVRAHPVAALLVDHYDDDWSKLWWVRIDAHAETVERDDLALRVLIEKYEQYRRTRPEGPLLVLRPERWTGWSYEVRSE